jgi:hypothetical protein
MKDFGKIGRTWWFVILVYVSTSVMMALKFVPVEIWQGITYVCLGAGTVKSATEKVAQSWNKPKQLEADNGK